MRLALLLAFAAGATGRTATAQTVPVTAEAQVAAARAAALQPAQALAADAARTADSLMQRSRRISAELDTLRARLTLPDVSPDTLRARSKAVADAVSGLPALADSGTLRATRAAGEANSDASRIAANASVVKAAPLYRQIVTQSGLVGTRATAQAGQAAPLVRGLADSVLLAGEQVANATMELAGLVASTALEATAPRLPVLTGSDNDVLEALRVRIVGGSIFSNGQARVVASPDGTTATVQSSQFAQAAVYLAFEAQPRVFGWTCWLACDTTPSRRERASKSVDEQRGLNRARASLQAQERRGYDRFYLDPSIALRLTTIPVTGAIQGSSSAENIQSKKAAQVVLAAVGAFNFGGFAVNKAQFHWGVGPLARVLFQSVSDNQRSTRVWNLEDDLYGSWTLGARLTLFEKDRKAGDLAQHGWAPAAYIDYSQGIFQNFETASARDTASTSPASICLRDPAACLAQGVPPQTDFLRLRRTRHYVEARVFLQYVYLGFDLNNGPGADDLRFIGGISMRLDQFFARR